MVWKTLRFIGLLLLLAVLFTLAAAGNEDKSVRGDFVVRDDAPLQRLSGDIHSDSLPALCAAFGAQTPYLTQSGSGTVANAAYAGGAARVLTWNEADGAVIRCVRPAEAAALLRWDALTALSGNEAAVGGMRCMLAQGEAGACAYFSDATAAYAICLPGGDIASLTQRLSGVGFLYQ